MSEHKTIRERLEWLQTDMENLKSGFMGTDVRGNDEEQLAYRMKSELKDRIIGLFREADAAVREAQSLKDSVKNLADQWKELDKALDLPEVAPAVSNPRVDHLGASTFIDKGWSRLAMGDPAAARTALERALELAPNSNEAEALLSWAYMIDGRLDIALYLVHRVLTRDPQYSLARVNLGYINIQKGLLAEAIRELTGVVQADNDRRATLYGCLYLGMAYRAQNQPEHAEQCFKAALTRGPNLLQSWYELGLLYLSVGRREDAVAAWKSGAQANRFNPWGKRCSEQLKEFLSEEEPANSGEAHALR